MKLLLLLLAPVLLVSCATKPVLPSALPKTTQLASPIVETIRKPVTIAAKANDDLRVSNSKIEQAVKSASITAENTRKVALSLQPGQVVTSESVDALTQSSRENQEQIIYLADLVNDQSRIIEGQSVELAAARDATEYAVTAATLKDQEADSLRDYAKARDDALTATLKENEKLTKKAANNAVYKAWVIGAVIFALLAASIFIGIKSIKPL